MKILLVVIPVVIFLALVIYRNHLVHTIDNLDDVCCELIEKERKRINLEYSLNRMTDKEHEEGLNELIAYTDRLSGKK